MRYNVRIEDSKCGENHSGETFSGAISIAMNGMAAGSKVTISPILEMEEAEQVQHYEKNDEAK